MERALVVVDETEQSQNLLRTAGEIAAATDAELFLLTTRYPDDFDESTSTLGIVGNGPYTDSMIVESDDGALESVHGALESTIEEAYENPSFAYRTLAGVTKDSERASLIIEAAETYDCDHVFLTGQRRSPTGKVLFGDTVQSVLLDFDGEVTVSLDN